MLRQTRQQIGPGALPLEFSRHIGGDGLDGRRLARHRLEFCQQVEFGVFHHRSAEIVERLDRPVAGKEIMRTRTKAEDLEVAHAHHHASDGRKVVDHLRDFVRQSDRLLRNVNGQTAQSDAVRTVEQAAERIAAIGRQHRPVLFGGGAGHRRARKTLEEQRGWPLRPKIAQIGHGRIAPLGDQFVASCHRLLFVLNDCRRRHGMNFELLQFGHDGIEPPLRQRDGKAVARDADDADADFGGVDQFHLQVSLGSRGCP